MRVASRSSSPAGTWRALSPEQRVAAIGAVLLIVSTFGPFSFVEAAIVLVAGAILVLLKKRAEGREFHLPFGDGTVIAVAALWCAFLIVVRLFDRPLGQNLLALGCAAILLAAGVRERARRPADDLPETRERRTPDWLADTPDPPEGGAEAPTEPLSRGVRAHGEEADRAPTRPLRPDSPTRPLPEEPPELRLPRRDPKDHQS